VISSQRRWFNLYAFPTHVHYIYSIHHQAKHPSILQCDGDCTSLWPFGLGLEDPGRGWCRKEGMGEGADFDCRYGVTHGDQNAGNHVFNLGLGGFWEGLGNKPGSGGVLCEGTGERGGGQGSSDGQGRGSCVCRSHGKLGKMRWVVSFSYGEYTQVG